MAKILVHVTNGPENPTRAALAFLVGKSAIEEGHSVSLFLTICVDIFFCTAVTNRPWQGGQRSF